MQWIVAAIVIGVMSVPLFGDEEARRAQVNAATTDAFDLLRREIRAHVLINDVTLGRFFDQANARDQLDAAIQSAEQIGGTRWLDEQTVQVRLEISGAEIMKAVERVAERNPKALPVPLHTFRERMKRDLSRRAFAATGTSTSASAADRLKPAPSQVAWRRVSDADRRDAIEAARANAIDRVIDSLRDVQWDYGKRHLADALAVPAVKDLLHDWVAARPITSIEFHDDLEVRLALAVSVPDLWPVIESSFSKQAAVATPKDQKEWDALHRQVESRLVPAVGMALAKSSLEVAPASVAVPSQPPLWTQDGASAEGVSAPVGGSKLKTARAAEAVALDRLRGRVNALPLNATMTVGDAAKKDHRIQEALARGLDQARISKVGYDDPSPGSVRVVMSVDLQAVWREIAGR